MSNDVMSDWIIKYCKILLRNMLMAGNIECIKSVNRERRMEKRERLSENDITFGQGEGQN